jgi:chemosensory pili system protein ChpC
MSEERHPVRSLLIPTLGGEFLVPNAAVAEIVGYREPQPVPGAPEWLLGVLSWREQMIPVMAIESVLGRAQPRASRGSRLIVVHALKRRGDLEFYGLLCNGFPRLIRIDNSNMSRDENVKPESKLIAFKVEVEGRPGEILDLEQVEDVVAARGSMAG